jgi:hypothetical protein
MATSSSLLSQTLHPEQRQQVHDLMQHPGWDLVGKAIQEQVQSVYNRLATADSRKEFLRLQGDLRTLNWVLGVPAELGRNPETIRRGR